ncbi:hypothetical protein ACFP1I_15335 [Dyadobacter subterraneus]|uniref:Uncharacterized protein n=1 Tax=Dyadobacter subterraneus TaxID=2773304 RepID=A0ABR9WBL2_9BACT|nr:hypothetical protein [Dyadobacter subterraneus]MBE9462863.1 hypothetical protein [Dyadobacter subterraneus]
MTKSEFEDLLLRFSKDECTKDENLQLRRWFRRIKVKRYMMLTDTERSLLEVKMLYEINRKIDANERPFPGNNLSGLLGTYLISAGIAAVLIMAIFLVKKYKSIGSLIKNEIPFELGHSTKKGLVFHEIAQKSNNDINKHK